MKVSVLYQLVRADFLERFRRYSTLIVTGLTIVLTYLYVPSINADYITLHMNGFRGIYNSAWIGAMVTTLTVILIPLPGFYLVKNAIESDRRTGVGQILATTPLRKWQYILGKMISNWVYLAAMGGVILVAAMIMQLMRGEDLTINPFDYLLPYLLLTLPMMALVAALAVLFESTSWLRGTLGNILYFFVFVGFLTTLGLMMIPVLRQIVGQGATSAEIWEPTGAFIAFKSMFIAGKAASPSFTGGLVIGATPVTSVGGIKTFVWSGINWSMYYAVERLLAIVLALALVALAAFIFDRFDQAIESSKPKRKAAIEPEEAAPSRVLPIPTISAAELTRARRSAAVPALLRMTIAELKVMLKGQAWWWYLAAAGLIAGGFLVSPEQGRSFLLPLAWLWPLALWSGLGNRDAVHRTQALFLSSPAPIGRQLLAGWLAGLVLALLMGSGAAVRLLVAGQLGAFAAYLVAAAFIPALALALGIWTGSSKPFEVFYLVLWYIGPMNQVAALDFIGASDAAVAALVPLYYLAFAILLLGAAVIGRARQFQLA